MSFSAWLANSAWALTAMPAYRAFVSALTAPEEVQRQKLSKYLNENVQTEFGRRYGFSRIRTAEDYADRIPITTYRSCQTDFGRIGSGEFNLLTQDTVTHLALTAGTGGAAKTIPYNATLKREFATAVATWVTDAFHAHPSLRAGPAYWSVSPAIDRQRSPAGLPIGFEEDSAYLGEAQQAIINRILAVPGSIRRIPDIDRLRRVTAFLLLRSADLRLVSVWHPSFFSLLCDWIADNWDIAIEDIRHGLHIAEIGKSFPANPARARDLEAHDPTKPEYFWPKLALISAWGSGAARNPLAELSQRFPAVATQPKGIIATEAIISLPFRDTYPLAITSHFFEFELVSGEVVPSWLLEKGMRGSPVVTTGGGLYRYRIDDILEISGHLGKTPCVRFISKRGLVSDLVGEKLEEEFVSKVLSNLFETRSINPHFGLLAPDRKATPDRYVLFLSTADGEYEDNLSEDLDRALSENAQYALARKLGQLGPSVVQLVEKNAREMYFTRLSKENGQRIGDIKPLSLSPLRGWDTWFGKS